MEIINLINSMAPFLLLGFLLAGIMHAFIPGSLYKRHFGQSNFKSVGYATLLAIPLPLCSCGVIPTAMSLRREGASRGSVIAFLIATPQTGVDSILATYSMMGLPFAILRPIAALVTALFGGQLANVIERHSSLKDEAPKKRNSAAANDELPKSFWEKIKVALRYAYIDMMEDIGKWLAVGLVIAGLITIYVPDEFFHQFADSPILGILMVLLFAIPMYLCATGSIPIAIALMLKGLTPGAALVLLMAGPAVNVASMLVIQRVMGTRTLMIYIASIVGGAILFALGVDYLFPRELFTATLEAHKACSHGGPSYFQWICTGFLTLLLINAFFHRYFSKQPAACSCQNNNGAAQCSLSNTPSYKVFIEGMKCNHCKANAEKAMTAVEGVENVSIDLAEGSATLRGHFKSEEIVDAVESIGFKVNKEKGFTALNAVASPVFKLFIEGMKCNHCKANAEKALTAVEGVENVSIDLAEGSATVQGHFNAEEAIDAVESIGFKVNKDKGLIAVSAANPATHIIYIEGMKCNHCKANAEKAIQSVAGVESVMIDLAAASATIQGACDMAEVIDAVESIGFKVKKDATAAAPAAAPAQTLHIEGMKCNHCKANVEKVSLTVEGVTHAEADLATSTLSVQGNFDKEELVSAIESIGFKVKK